MIQGLESIILGSANAKALADFYKEKVGLEVAMEFEMGDKGEKGYQLKMSSGSGLVILDHSEIKGKNYQPQRFIINLEVDEIEKDVERLKSAGVKLVQDIYHLEDYGFVATFEDIDGNYFQLVKVKP